ncbi:DinB family protein [Psychroserpens ponticola]|uniref:DinB family protein n=1 Tax=Psychroserpens ponticola TaxID=2932268 RepID=A0ABY7RW25_9FLAO|nr:DinB family protein [Psychroserpens ponticola]WCO00962.1 DinB family protein [Psychroserpens ponticola]
MESSKQLAQRFRELFLNGKWIANTNYQELLSNVTRQQAIQKISSLNTIAILTFHINYYVEGVLQVLEGGSLDIKDKYSFDAPEIKSEDDWNTLKLQLFANTEAFATHIESMTKNQLESTFVDEKYGSYRRNIEGLIEHSYYHFGQLSLIKKMVNNN